MFGVPAHRSGRQKVGGGVSETPHRCDGKCAELHICEAKGYDGSACGKPAAKALLSYAKRARILDSFGPAHWFCEAHARALQRIAREARPDGGPEWDGR